MPRSRLVRHPGRLSRSMMEIGRRVTRIFLHDLLCCLLHIRQRYRVCMSRQLRAFHLRVVVHPLAGLQPTLDDRWVWGSDERFGLFRWVEHLSVASKAHGSCSLLSSVSFVEVDDEPYDPCEGDCAAGDDTGYCGRFGTVSTWVIVVKTAA